MKRNSPAMATSSFSDCSRGLTWFNPCRQPLRPATTSPSFYPYQKIGLCIERESIVKTKQFYSLPSTPPKPTASTLKEYFVDKEGNMSFFNGTKALKKSPPDENGNRYLPEWYFEPCVEVLNRPCDENNKLDLDSEPLDQMQKMEQNCDDSSYDDEFDFSEGSQPGDFDINPNSDEISKLNSLGQGQSRFMSLFKCKDEGSSCCSSSSMSEKFEDFAEVSTSSENETVSFQDIDESKIVEGIEAVCQGLARLLSIPAETSLMEEFPDEVSTLENPTNNDSTAEGSRLLKLFSTTSQPHEENNDPSKKPVCNGERSGLSFLNAETSFSAGSSLRSSPIYSKNPDCAQQKTTKIPNVASISPTAPLHYRAASACQISGGFPNQETIDIGSSAYTACDLSNEEKEIEAALERGDGFFTNDDQYLASNARHDDSIWSPTRLQDCYMEESFKIESISPITLKQIASDAANDIMVWLDDLLSHCSDKGSQNICQNDIHTPLEDKMEEDEKSFQTAALKFYTMFENNSDNSTLQKIFQMTDEVTHSDSDCNEETFFAQFTQSPGILDFLIENDVIRDNDNCTEEHRQTQFSGQSLQLLLNSRSSDIYNSYLLFPDLVHFTTPTNSNGSLPESTLLSHIFSTSFDWMGNVDSDTKCSLDHTLQSLSPRTPFTPTGNLGESWFSNEKRQAISLEHLCNLATVATSIEPTDFFVQYLQSQLSCFENLSIFQSPFLQGHQSQNNSDEMYWNENSTRLYRPIPLFPLQFINRLSLTNYSEDERRDNSENLLFSSETHFRPITPGPTMKNDQSSIQSPVRKTRREKEESHQEDIDDELVAIHEGADHSKLVEIYAQMQLKQQLAAEQKINYPQLVAVEDDGSTDEEVAFEDKHLSNQQREDVNAYDLDCAAEAAATVAVNALGSADPAEALALLEEWHWKESSNEEQSVSKTFSDLGYFEPTYPPDDEKILRDEVQCQIQPLSVLEEKSSTHDFCSWSRDDGSSSDQNFEYDSLKNIWIESHESSSPKKDLHQDLSKQKRVSGPCCSLHEHGIGHTSDDNDDKKSRKTDCYDTASWQILLSHCEVEDQYFSNPQRVCFSKEEPNFIDQDENCKSLDINQPPLYRYTFCEEEKKLMPG